MRRNESLEEKINRLQSDRNVLLTKAGELNSGEKAWIAHIEAQLMECGVILDNAVIEEAA